MPSTETSGKIDASPGWYDGDSQTYDGLPGRYDGDDVGGDIEGVYDTCRRGFDGVGGMEPTAGVMDRGGEA